MLPHAAHAREVVLELRQLDLELALGAHGVLGEDVEDQLRAVDHARLERVLEEALLHRIELVVDEQALGLRVREPLSQLLELALADVRALRRAAAMLDDAADRLDAGGARELLDLGQLVVGVRSLSQNREDEPALRLRENVESSGALCPLRVPESTLADADARARRHPVAVARGGRALPLRQGARAAAGRCTTTASRSSTRQRGRQAARAARRAHRHRAGAGQPARAGSRTASVHGLGATRHEGRPRGDDRARALGGRAPSSPTTSGCSSSRARSSARTTTRCPASSRRRRSSTRRRS